MQKKYLHVTAEELFTICLIIDDADNFGVPWFWSILTAVNTHDLQQIYEAFHQLQQEVEAERGRLAGKRSKKLPKKKKKKDDPPPQDPPTGWDQ